MTWRTPFNEVGNVFKTGAMRRLLRRVFISDQKSFTDQVVFHAIPTGPLFVRQKPYENARPPIVKGNTSNGWTVTYLLPEGPDAWIAETIPLIVLPQVWLDKISRDPEVASLQYLIDQIEWSIQMTKALRESMAITKD